MALFRKYGFRAVTMDEVARASGISKKTLYQHFSNKEEVVKEVMLDHQKHLCAHCKVAEENSNNAIEAYMLVIAEMDKQFRSLNPIVFTELQRFFPSVFKDFQESGMEENVRMVHDNINRGKEEGLYREDLKPELLSKYRIETIMMVLHSDMLMNLDYAMTEVMQVISEHFLYGLLNPKGEKFYNKLKEKIKKQV